MHAKRLMPIVAVLAVLAAAAVVPAGETRPDDAAARRVRLALDKAAGFWASIATGGGWAGIYSLDLKERWGESLNQKVKDGCIWIQPPGTPTIGQTFLRAYRATGNRAHLEAARAAGRSLWWSRQKSGGWRYIVDVSTLKANSTTPPRPDGRCTIDDRTTQGAVEFLMDLDETLDEPWLDEAVALGLGFFTKSQFPNGAWPQLYPLGGDYHDHYTFNDSAINDCITVMLEAHARYGRAEYMESARRGGDFIILSQLPRPQAGWAQQYSADMKPAWARAFEPPGVCSAVTGRNIRTLVQMYHATGDEKYLAPMPAAAEWLEASKLSDNRWARLYEVGTNRPIYGDRDNKIHYTLDEISDERLTGYSWQGDYGIRKSIELYERAKQSGLRKPAAPAAAPSKPDPARARALEPGALRAAAALDSEGRWTRDDRLYAKTFVANMQTLIDYVAASGDAGK